MAPPQAEARGGCANVRDWRFSLKTLHNGKVISLNHLLKVWVVGLWNALWVDVDMHNLVVCMAAEHATHARQGGAARGGTRSAR